MIEDILKNLWNNWMFRLSLSSNELFHSNFLQTALSDPLPDMANEHAGVSSWARVQEFAAWVGLDAAWLAERQVEYALHPVFVYREWKDLDLAIVVRVPRENGGYREVVIFAVEVKIKSYPALEQVKRYLALMVSHNRETAFIPRLVLLSLVPPPPHFNLIENLTVSHFGALAEGIAHVVPYQPALQAPIDEYARLCQLLDQLSQFWNESLSPLTPLHAVTGQRNVYRRLNPIWSKLCAAYLCELVKQEMADFALHDDITLQIDPGFSRSTWKADFLWCASSGGAAAREVIAKAGVQVEGDTIRFMLNAQNVGSGGVNARLIVQETLLAQANASGLYQRLHQLYCITQEPNVDLAVEVTAFWQNANGIRRDNYGIPCLSLPQGDFTLPGYNNSPTFGHADYRLKLHKNATLNEICHLVCAALRGEYNANGAAAFLPVLTDLDVF
ncbi:hypothetical protein OU994_07400 [Pseudoduganella sp. SL102]|uniref:hypothetical protein n=1 Tax=Pseudoduganella sp. SL102 TaxID=2995154 RepID=UPI00248C817E|nr:hypothetical protein [Pseudoduganella sp. SL102]WBS04102.1 hypothetical protein OU994_07400 [Pseudoduganella sp. SL102]